MARVKQHLQLEISLITLVGCELRYDIHSASKERMEFQSPSINKRQKSIKQFYVKYQEVILFNRNIIIAAVASITADAVVVHYSAEAISNDILVSLISIITDTGNISLHSHVLCSILVTGGRSISMLLQEREIQVGSSMTQEKQWLLLAFLNWST